VPREVIMTLDRIEITIPVLNEEATLEDNVRKVLGFLDTLGLDTLGERAISLVIADNGSADATEAIGRRLAEETGRVRYLRLPSRGVGLALKTSWLGSSADIVGYMDLDLATDLAHLPEAFAALRGGADLVYGSRLHRNSVVSGRTLKREVVSRLFNLILRSYLGAKFSDGMCGFKFLRRSILEPVIAQGAESNGWFFSTELMFVAQKLGYRLHELPVRWTDDPNTRVRIGRLTLEYLKAMRRLKHRNIQLATQGTVA
jgi:glycosyltransferase involved in cell wall biosynthesis